MTMKIGELAELVGSVLGIDNDALAKRLGVDRTDFAGIRCNLLDATPEQVEKLSKLVREAFFSPCLWKLPNICPVPDYASRARVLGFFLSFNDAGLPFFSYGTLAEQTRDDVLLAWTYLPEIEHLPPELRAEIADVFKKHGLALP